MKLIIKVVRTVILLGLLLLVFRETGFVTALSLLALYLLRAGRPRIYREINYILGFNGRYEAVPLGQR